MPFVEIIVMVIGLIPLGVSLALYQTRTRDKQFLTRLWLDRELLTSVEYYLNRIGLAICVIAVIIAAARLGIVLYINRES